MPHIVHAHMTLGNIQRGTVEVASLEEARAHMALHLGPFPILFEAPPENTCVVRGEPGIVITALVHIPGGAERPGPFLGAQLMGYVPAVKGPNGNGQNIIALGILKTPAWFERTEPTGVEKPFVSTDPLPEGA